MLQTHKSLIVFFVLMLLCNGLLWLSVRHDQARWNNVPPAPSVPDAVWAGIGDSGLAYRSLGIMLQNLGDTGGRTTNINKYNYDALTEWFFVMDRLDPKSNFIPYLAAYYFGGTQEEENIRALIPYLEYAGNRTEWEKWRWLAHAVFLARFELNDQALALRLANKLAAINNPDMPGWTRQMPVFILNSTGEKKEAEALMLMLMKEGLERFEPEEVNSMKFYLCEQILGPAEAGRHPLCEGLARQ